MVKGLGDDSGHLLSVTFVVPTFNSQRSIEKCIKSVLKQNYPKDKLDIIISDGGSSDDTLKIVKRYGCRIIHNPKRLAEPGVALGMRVSTSDINFVLAADNELPRKDWLRLMVKPFQENPDIYGVFTQVVGSKKDTDIMKYLILLHANPLLWFVLGDEANPRSMEKSYQVIEKTESYEVFDFTLEKFPAIAFAQGFGVRRDFVRSIESEYDDILPVIEMIKKDLKIAYVPKAGVYHHHVRSLKALLGKYKTRVIERFGTETYGYKSRERFLSKQRRIRQYLWFLYSLSCVLPMVDAIKGYAKDRDRAWLYHPIVCFSLTTLMMLSFIRLKIVRSLKGR